MTVTSVTVVNIQYNKDNIIFILWNKEKRNGKEIKDKETKKGVVHCFDEARDWIHENEILSF